MTERVRVLLISGYSRSGSTLLMRILGAIDGLAAPGELRYLWQRGLVENRVCDCGRRFRSCPFWQEVLQEAFGGMSAVDVDTIRAATKRVVRVHRIPALAAGSAGDRARKEQEVLLSSHERLYRAIERVSGARVIVDSSKDPAFGHLLANSNEIDLSVVHLVRDSRAVAHSWTRLKHDPGTGRPMARQSSARSGVEWLTANVAASWLNHRVRYSIRLRYEDLVSTPGGAVGQVLGLIGEGALLPLDHDRVRVEPGHAVSGNPLRFQQGEITVTEDATWRDEMSQWDRLVSTGISWPGLMAFGYLRPGGIGS